VKMENKWRACSLGDVIELKRGYDLPKQKRNAGEVPIVSSSGVGTFHSEAMVKAPGVVTGRYGTIGQVFFIKQDFWPLNTTLYVRDFKGNEPRFISYFLRCIDFLAYSDKAAVPGVNRNDLHQAKVYLPPLPEQRAIAHILGTLDDRIDNLHQTNATLEAMAQALFKSWFVDFDGVPPEEMQESELGLIPKGWNYKPVKDLAKIGIGKTPPRKESQWFTKKSSDWRWVSIRDMGNHGIFQQETSEFLTADAVSRFNIRIVPDKSILLSFKLTVGRVAITDGETLTNEAIAHFVLPHETCIPPEYLYLYLKKFDFSALGSTSSIATAVNSKMIREISILVAEPVAIKKFTKIVSPIFDAIRNNQHEIRTLATLRDTLLPRLISGQLRIPQ